MASAIVLYRNLFQQMEVQHRLNRRTAGFFRGPAPPRAPLRACQDDQGGYETPQQNRRGMLKYAVLRGDLRLHESPCQEVEILQRFEHDPYQDRRYACVARIDLPVR